jgi:hypothetical protein
MGAQAWRERRASHRVAFAGDEERARGELRELDDEDLQEVIQLLRNLLLVGHVVQRPLGVREASADRLVDEKQVRVGVPACVVASHVRRGLGVGVDFHGAVLWRQRERESATRVSATADPDSGCGCRACAARGQRRAAARRERASTKSASSELQPGPPVSHLRRGNQACARCQHERGAAPRSPHAPAASRARRCALRARPSRAAVSRARVDAAACASACPRRPRVMRTHRTSGSVSGVELRLSKSQ